MINIILRGIVSNTNKIESIVDHITKTEKKNALSFILLTTGIWCVAKVVMKQGERIYLLEEKLEEIKSKGE